MTSKLFLQNFCCRIPEYKLILAETIFNRVNMDIPTAMHDLLPLTIKNWQYIVYQVESVTLFKFVCKY